MKYVLFSAVGASDPVRGSYDGPMLHVVRHYRPYKVYLILTAAMAQKERDTSCYSRAILYLLPDCEIDLIFTEIENAADFDAFHDLFSHNISRIRKENPDASILLNLSSGTPQMKQAMSLEVISHHVITTPVQVSTPAGKVNSDIPHYCAQKDDLEYELENLMDNLAEASSRCSEPGLVGQRKNIVKNQIRDQISKWGYVGAYILICDNAPLFAERAKLLVEHAYLRSLPDEKGARVAARKLGLHDELYPIRDAVAHNVCEYFLLTSLRLKRGEITDFFLRAYTLAEYLSEVEVDRALGVGGIESIARKTSSGGWEIDHLKAARNHPNLLPVIENQKYLNIKEREAILIKLEARQNGLSGYEKITTLYKLRNNCTHSLQSVSVAHFTKEGTSAKELMQTLQNLILSIFGRHIKPPIFDTFTRLNALISQALDDTPKN